MSHIDENRIAVPIRQLIEIVSGLEPNLENEEAMQLLRQMESLAEQVDRKMWYQRKVVSDLII